MNVYYCFKACRTGSLAVDKTPAKCTHLPGGPLGLKHAWMCVSKSEGNGSFFGIMGMK